MVVVRSGPDLAGSSRYPAGPAIGPGKPHLLVYLGEICKQDGVDHMVRAVQLLRERRPDDFHVLFVGGGPHQPAIKAYAEEQGIMDYAGFTGRVSDEALCRILSSATLGIDPDPKNPWSDKSTMNKVIEYMYFGLPVVAFDLHETRVSAGEAGATPSRTTNAPWPPRSPRCWTTRPGAPPWPHGGRPGARRAGLGPFGGPPAGGLPIGAAEAGQGQGGRERHHSGHIQLASESDLPRSLTERDQLCALRTLTPALSREGRERGAEAKRTASPLP